MAVLKQCYDGLSPHRIHKCVSWSAWSARCYGVWHFLLYGKLFLGRERPGGLKCRCLSLLRPFITVGTIRIPAVFLLVSSLIASFHYKYVSFKRWLCSACTCGEAQEPSWRDTHHYGLASRSASSPSPTQPMENSSASISRSASGFGRQVCPPLILVHPHTF